jgi:hypothetical protein
LCTKQASQHSRFCTAIRRSTEYTLCWLACNRPPSLKFQILSSQLRQMANRAAGLSIKSLWATRQKQGCIWVADTSRAVYGYRTLAGLYVYGYQSPADFIWDNGRQQTLIWATGHHQGFIRATRHYQGCLWATGQAVDGKSHLQGCLRTASHY